MDHLLVSCRCEQVRRHCPLNFIVWSNLAPRLGVSISRVCVRCYTLFFFIQHILIMSVWYYDSVLNILPYTFFGKLSSDTAQIYLENTLLERKTHGQYSKGTIEKQTRIANTDVWTDPSQNFITFVVLKSQCSSKPRILRANCSSSAAALTA